MNAKHAALVVITALALSGVISRAETKEEKDKEKRDARDLPRKELLYGSNILGETVENTAGDKVGSIRELMIDPKSGKIEFGVVTVNPGFLGIGSKQVAIPWDQFHLSPTRHGYLLDVNRQALVERPAFEDRRLDDRKYERTFSSTMTSDDRTTTEAKDLKHYSGKVTAVDPAAGTIQVKKLMTTHTFTCGAGRMELNRFTVGQEVEVDYSDVNGDNVVESIQAATK